MDAPRFESESENLPSAPVTVPFDVPGSTTVAPTRGWPSPLTVPERVNFPPPAFLGDAKSRLQQRYRQQDGTQPMNFRQ